MCKLSPETIKNILAQGKIYEVGGAVRDRYLAQKNIKDRDYLVTGINYNDLSKILNRFGRVDLVGRSFGVMKFTQNRNGQPFTFDISLPRKEYSTGVGHTDFEVDFDPTLSVEDDLLRRDFTVNAMAIAVDSDQLVDPLEGMVDLQAKQLRMTSVASFTEDPLRMLRAIQFAARFGFKIEAKTLEALIENGALIKTISPERIAEELNKLLTRSPEPSVGFRLMRDTGLLKHILPELSECVDVDQPGGFHKYDVFEHSLRCIDAVPESLHLRLAALFHDINKPQAKRLTETGATFYGHESASARTAKKVLKRLKYSNETVSDVATLVDRHMFTTDVTDKGRRRLIRKVGLELIFDLLNLRRADVVAQGMGGVTDDVDQFEREIRDEIAAKPPFGLNDLAINGRDIMMELKLGESPDVGKILDYLMEQVLDDPAQNVREILMTKACEFHSTMNNNSTGKCDKENQR
ncbi:MAG: HD domain-containing protein [candidate division Zixibacteria bacterium]